MGWLNYVIFGDLGQQFDIEALRDRIAETDRRQARARASVSDRLTDLAEENADLKLRLGVLIRLLVARGVLSAEELSAMLLTDARAPTDPAPSTNVRPE